jgi:cytochrome c oxidase accessory protein FixG
MAILTLTTFFFGGFFREQICIYACPWPRIQAAMMDEDTLTVAYRDWRGEPRGKHRKSEDADRLGDCIDCSACVNVCPQGIDIRDGQQLACITCALCIDACDDVMDKVGKPRGLIGYLALTDEAAERAGNPPKSIWAHVLRPRTILYTVLWAGIGVMLVVALFLRSDVEVNVTPVRNPTFVLLSDGSVRNSYDLRIRNKLGDERMLFIGFTAEDPLVLTVEGQPNSVLTVPANATLNQRIHITALPGSSAANAPRTELRLWVGDTAGSDRAHYDTTFTGKAD